MRKALSNIRIFESNYCDFNCFVCYILFQGISMNYNKNNKEKISFLFTNLL